MQRYQSVLPLTDEQREELTRWAQSRTLPAGDVFRARLVLALADGTSVITSKPAIRYHFKTGQRKLIQNKSSYSSLQSVLQTFL